MKKLTFASLLFTLLLFSSCVRNFFYAPVRGAADIIYQPKPFSADSLKRKFYISGSYGTDAGANLTDNNSYQQLNLSAGHTYDHLNFSYGGFGFTGNFKNKSIEETSAYYFDKKSYYGFGLKSSVNYFFTTGTADWRILGLELCYSKEFGNYSDFRKSIVNAPDFYTNTNDSQIIAGLSSEVLIRIDKNSNSQLGFRIFLGDNLKDDRLYGQTSFFGNPPVKNSKDRYPLLFSESAFLKVKNFYVLAETGLPFNSRLSLGYNF